MGLTWGYTANPSSNTLKYMMPSPKTVNALGAIILAIHKGRRLHTPSLQAA